MPDNLTRAAPRLIVALGLLWLAGAAMRLPLLAVPPVIPLIHNDLHMSEAQVGLLIGLPILMFAIAAIPGSLLIARAGADRIMVLGLFIIAAAAAGRAAADQLWWLYAMTVAMGFGVAIMQPAVPTLAREWMPQRTALAIAVSSNGLLGGAALGPTLTGPLVLPLVGPSWRLDFLAWSLPSFAIAVMFLLAVLRRPLKAPAADAAPRHWWPDWNNPLIWLLGLTFGSNNAFYYSMQAFLPDYLNSTGRPDWIGPALGWMNVAQLIASCLLLVIAERLERRIWPFLVFGVLPAVSVAGIVLLDGIWIAVAAGVTGFSLAITFVMVFALPPALAPPDDVHRMAGAMFAISYTIAVLVPVMCGAVWDLTGVPWTAFLPVGGCALTLTTIGIMLTRRQAAR